MAVALLTNIVPAYRVPLFERLHRRLDVEVLCWGPRERFLPSWLTGALEAGDEAPFPVRPLRGAPEAWALGRRYDAVIAPYGGGSIMPLTYLGARRFVLWASVWAQPWSPAHALALPVTRRIYRRADAVVAYGEHVRRYVAGIRGHDEDVFVAPQSVEADLFGRTVEDGEIAGFRARHGLGGGPLVLYVGRLVAEKGVELLLEAWEAQRPDATLVLAGEGPLRERCRGVDGVMTLGALSRAELPVAYAACELTVLPALATPRFREPWGLVCNEAMHQARPVIASDAVGAAAGGLVRDGETGLVLPAGDVRALGEGLQALLGDATQRARLGRRARELVAGFNYDVMADAFARALEVALTRSGPRPAPGPPRWTWWPTRRRT